MQIHTTTDLPQFKNAVITIGTFDGVHKGHQHIIDTLIKKAVEVEGESVVISFYPHPRTVVNPNALLQVLNTPIEKKLILKNTGIDHLIIYPFTEAFSNLTAQEYIEEFIVKQFAPKAVIIGFDHRFGKDRNGNIELLHQVAAQHNFEVIEIPPQTIEQNKISSTQIRNALLYGEIEKANALLGYSYPLTGTVVLGKQLGRTIGFKTANLHLDDTQKLIPGNGVYIVEVQWDEIALKGMMNIGTRPTVDGTHRTIEVHILDFDTEIYNEVLTVSMLQRLRNEQKFENLDALKAQLQKDKQATIEYFSK